jgi:hypothetical protein
MTLKTTRQVNGWSGRTKQLAQLAVSALDEISAFYAGMARILIGRVEDFSDLEAERRLRRLNLAAAKHQLAPTKQLRRGG